MSAADRDLGKCKICFRWPMAILESNLQAIMTEARDGDWRISGDVPTLFVVPGPRKLFQIILLTPLSRVGSDDLSM
jgi:hypothetical protein